MYVFVNIIIKYYLLHTILKTMTQNKPHSLLSYFVKKKKRIKQSNNNSKQVQTSNIHPPELHGANDIDTSSNDHNDDDVHSNEISMSFDDGSFYGMILSNNYDNGYMIGQYCEPGNS